jgi:hypothetical protein
MVEGAARLRHRSGTVKLALEKDRQDGFIAVLSA